MCVVAGTCISFEELTSTKHNLVPSDNTTAFFMSTPTHASIQPAETSFSLFLCSGNAIPLQYSMEAPRTVTETETETDTPLHLRLQPARPAVRWAEDVIDNEEMNKKRSNSDL